jgi:N6-adenosine-specific RNA methylase IME4
VKYRTIVADPPWPIPRANRRAGRRRYNIKTVVPYPMMELDAIAALPVGGLATPDAHLYLWVTPAFIRDGTGKRIAEAWGFRVVSELVWEKNQMGMGWVPRNAHETVLICKRGAAPFLRRDVRSVQRWNQPRTPGGGKKHSAKPEGFFDLVERVSPGPYLELFARRHRLGWSVWGNEVESHIALGAD